MSMATATEITELRINTQELVNTEPYTDEFLSDLIDTYGQTDAERKIWVAKRNQVAELVDISEGGSSRKNSQLFESYSKIVASYGEDATVATGGARSPMTREITRD